MIIQLSIRRASLLNAWGWGRGFPIPSYYYYHYYYLLLSLLSILLLLLSSCCFTIITIIRLPCGRSRSCGPAGSARPSRWDAPSRELEYKNP